jgi:hypothetical protein
MTRLFVEADRLLVAEGSPCVSITHGETPVPRLVTWAWKQLHALEPRLLGGCRPLNLQSHLSTTHWRIAYSRVITRFGIPSAVLVATKQVGENAEG